MLASFIISFREAFEALIIIVLIVTYLKGVGKKHLVKPVIVGGIAAVVASISLGIIIYLAYVATLVFINKALIEAISAFIAVAVLTSVIYWMARKGPKIKQEIREKIEEKIFYNKPDSVKVYLSMASIGFIIVFREGIETILFSLPLILQDILSTTLGLVAGTILSLGISYTIFRYGVRISLRKFFYITSILLILIASGMLGYGVHEVLEYGEDIGIDLGILSQPLYKINISADNPLHEENIVGTILSILIGYTTEMELLRAIVQLSYLFIALTIISKVYRMRK